MKVAILALAPAAMLASGGVAAQAVLPAAAPPLVTGAPEAAILRSGTPIALKMSEELTTKEKAARVGQRFNLEVAEPIELGGVVVIPAGTPAVGEITDVRNKGMWGKSGRINARVLSLRVNGRQIRLSGSVDDKGVTGTGGVVAAIAFVPVAGFFTTGTSARIPMGAPVKAFLDEDVPVAMAAAVAPQPLMVPAPMPAMAPAAPAAPVLTPAATPLAGK